MVRGWNRLAGDNVQKVLVMNGIHIPIEWPKGSVRQWANSDYKRPMFADYGYIAKSVGDDGEELDVYVGPNLDSKMVLEIQQLKDGEHDEMKYMLGYDTVEEAVESYLAHMDKEKLGEYYTMDIADFKTMCPEAAMIKEGGFITREELLEYGKTSKCDNCGEHSEKYVFVDTNEGQKMLCPKCSKEPAMKIGNLVKIAIDAKRDIIGRITMVYENEKHVAIKTAVGTGLVAMEDCSPIKVKFATDEQELNYLNIEMDRLKEDKKQTNTDEEEEAVGKRIEEIEIETRKVNERMAFATNFFEKEADDIEDGNEKTLRSPATVEVSEEAEDTQLGLEHRKQGVPGEGVEREIKLAVMAICDGCGTHAECKGLGGDKYCTKCYPEMKEHYKGAMIKQADGGSVTMGEPPAMEVEADNDDDDDDEMFDTGKKTKTADMNGAIQEYLEYMKDTGNYDPAAIEDIAKRNGVDPREMVRTVDLNADDKRTLQAQVTVSETWMPDGTISRDIKFDEVNPQEAEALMSLINHAPEQSEENLDLEVPEFGDESIEEENGEPVMQPETPLHAHKKTAEVVICKKCGHQAHSEDMKDGICLDCQDVRHDKEYLEKGIGKKPGVWGRKKIAQDNGPTDEQVNEMAEKIFGHPWNDCSSDEQDEIYVKLGYPGGVGSEKTGMQSPADQGLNENAIPNTKSEDAQGSQENAPFKAPSLPGQNFAKKKTAVSFEEVEIGDIIELPNGAHVQVRDVDRADGRVDGRYVSSGPEEHPFEHYDQGFQAKFDSKDLAGAVFANKKTKVSQKSLAAIYDSI